MGIRLRCAAGLALACLGLSAGEFPRVWAECGSDADWRTGADDLRAHGVQAVNVATRDVTYCRAQLAALRAAGLRAYVAAGEPTKYASLVSDFALPVVHSVLCGGRYANLAIDRTVFAFAAKRHEIEVRPPVTTGGRPYAGISEPLRAEAVVPLARYDGGQHLKIVPAALAKLSPDERGARYRMAFDLTGFDAAMLDHVGLAVYWEVRRTAKTNGLASPAAETTREAGRRAARAVLETWREANGGTFPSDVIVALRAGDEQFNLASHVHGANNVGYPLWDYSAPGIASFAALAKPGETYPRTWGYPEIYGADAYACWLYAFHANCAGVLGEIRAVAHALAPEIVVFRNTVRDNVWELSNDHDGTGQELCARALDAVSLDPYPVGRGAYREMILHDEGYCSGFSRRFGKPLFPWLQAHLFSGISEITPDDVRRMGEEHRAFGVDAVIWFGYGDRKDLVFPRLRADSWDAAGTFNRGLAAHPPSDPKATVAVLRPYAVRALAHQLPGQRNIRTFRNPADRLLELVCQAMSERGLVYDVFEIPPREDAVARAKRETALRAYSRVVSTLPYPGAFVVGAGTEGTVLKEDAFPARKAEFARLVATW